MHETCFEPKLSILPLKENRLNFLIIYRKCKKYVFFIEIIAFKDRRFSQIRIFMTKFASLMFWLVGHPRANGAQLLLLRD